MTALTEPTSLRIGTLAGHAVAALSVCYAIVLSIGLATLPSPADPIQNPWFTLMEVLILAIAPAMLAFIVGLHAWVAPRQRPVALLGVAFMSLCAGLTCCVHFTVLTLSRHPLIAAHENASLVFAFTWPSVVYALDILAWDFFFPLAVLCAALAVRGRAEARWARTLLFASAGLAFVGLLGIPTANMSIRNVGIVGYVLLFPWAAVLLAGAFERSAADASHRSRSLD